MATETKEMKLYQEKLSFSIRQGYLTEENMKRIEQVTKAILDSPIEEVLKCWGHFSWGDESVDTPVWMHFAVYSYPGVAARLVEAITWKYGESE